MAIADRQAGRVALHFAAKFVRRLEPNLARIHDRLLHQMQEPFFLKIGLGNPVFPNSREESLELGGRKRPRAGEDRRRNETKNYWKTPSHEIIDLSPFGPNLCLKISVLLPPSQAA